MDGKAVSAQLIPQLKSYVRELAETRRCIPTLAAILIGDDPASRQYVRNKQRYASELNIGSELIALKAAEVNTDHLLEIVDRLNRDERIAGILIQLPLPDHVDRYRLFEALDPFKDVDAVSSASTWGFYRGEWGRFIPCTPRGVLGLLEFYQVPVQGARAAVIGRSDIAGKPMAVILGGRMCNATVTWCHRFTRDLPAICREADIIVSCVGIDAGQRYLITRDMVKPGSCVIDVGFRRIGSGRFVGDVDFDSVKEVAGWVTLNPGGTGPMTVLALMQNLIDAARYRHGMERASYSF